MRSRVEKFRGREVEESDLEAETRVCARLPTGGFAMILRTWLSRLLASSPVSRIPVRVRKGPARGARWTLLPFSYNWREGGEADLQPGLARLAQVSGAVCWDFGAHFGIHTVGMARQVGPSGQVVAFEPDAVAFARLELHVVMNRLANVVLFRAAVSSSKGVQRLISASGPGSTVSHFRYPGEAEPEEHSSVAVEMIAPDDLVQLGRIRPPDLIKVDVEGHGASALQGSLSSIRNKLPVIIFSSHSPTEINGARDLLEPLGYGVKRFSGASASWDDLEVGTGNLLTHSSTTSGVGSCASSRQSRY